jgi:hypothetical protein
VGPFALPIPAQAQRLPASAPEVLSGVQLGALLGTDEATLQQSFPQLHKAARPVPGPHGTRGLWMLSDELVAGLKFDTVFFFKARRLERIEQRRELAPQVCAKQFDQLTALLETRMGNAVRSSDLSGDANRSAAWSIETYRLAAFQTLANGSCTVMLVHEPLIAKDAAEL